jgi:hypothetical protein
LSPILMAFPYTTLSSLDELRTASVPIQKRT